MDIEFTAHFSLEKWFRVNLLQCRPFQVKIGGEDLLIMKESDIMGVLEGKSASKKAA